MFLIVIIFLYVINFSITENINVEYFTFLALIFIGFLLNYSKFNPNNYINLFYFILLINLFALLQEKFTGKYLLDYGNQFTLRQGQGIFGWTKIQGEFLIAVSCLFPKSRTFLFIALFSAVLSGVRASVLLITILILMNFYSFRLRLFFGFFVGIFGIYWLDQFFEVSFLRGIDQFAINRFLSLFDVTSSTYSVREQVHAWHLGCIADYSVLELIAGKGSFCERKFNWGAESTFLHVLEYYGILMLIVLSGLMVSFLLQNLKQLNLFKVAIMCILIIYMWNWRMGFTFSGIFIWWYIFKIPRFGDT